MTLSGATTTGVLAVEQSGARCATFGERALLRHVSSCARMLTALGGATVWARARRLAVVGDGAVEA